jgi:hypothetical protein
MDVMESPIARAIFKTREVVLGAAHETRPHPTGLIDMTRAMGWGVLAEVRDRQIVMGAVTRPWEANVVFRSIPPDQFKAFAEPDYVKIVWTLRVDSTGDHSCIFRTETRAVATDARARSRFRRYWSFVSPGIFLIRWLSLEPLKAEAERRAREGLEARDSRLAGA